MGIKNEEVAKISNYDQWFINEIAGLVKTEKKLKENSLNRELYLQAKSQGFSDEKIIELKKENVTKIKKIKKSFDLKVSYRNIDTCAAEFSSMTPYMYSSWDCNDQNDPYEKETNVTKKKKVIIIGGGPNRIGQGIELSLIHI